MATREEQPAGRHPSMQRQLVATGATLVAMVVCAFIIENYDLSGGFTPLIAGALFGLAMAEVVLTVARGATRLLAGVASACAAIGLYWGGRLGNKVGALPTGVYIAVVVAAVVAPSWVLGTAARRRAKAN